MCVGHARERDSGAGTGDGWNAHVVVARVPDVAFQERRRLGSNSVTSHVVARRTNLPEVAKVVPTPISPVDVLCASRWPEM